MKKNRITKLLVLVLSLIFAMLPITSAIAMETPVQDEQSLLEPRAISSTDINNDDYAALSRAGWEQRGPGGRHDITLGTHNETQYVLAQFTKDTWVQYWDKNWEQVWAGTFNSGITHTLMCNSSVYTISIYLPEEGFVSFRR